MKKWEIGLLAFFLVVSTIYGFVYPSQSLDSPKAEISYTIYVEGAKEETVTFDIVPTVLDVFVQLDIENEYGLYEKRQLEDGQTIYIPTKVGISLNSASMEELMELSGVGEVTASKIIEYRQENTFELIEDIQNVSGIGEKTYLKLREYLCL